MLCLASWTINHIIGNMVYKLLLTAFHFLKSTKLLHHEKNIDNDIEIRKKLIDWSKKH